MDDKFGIFRPDILLQIAPVAALSLETSRRMYDSDRTGHMFVQKLIDRHPGQFHQIMRIDKRSFLLLSDYLETKGLVKQTWKGITVKEQITIFLFIVGQPASVSLMEETFQHSGESIGR